MCLCEHISLTSKYTRFLFSLIPCSQSSTTFHSVLCLLRKSNDVGFYVRMYLSEWLLSTQSPVFLHFLRRSQNIIQLFCHLCFFLCLSSAVSLLLWFTPLLSPSISQAFFRPSVSLPFQSTALYFFCVRLWKFLASLSVSLVSLPGIARLSQ